MLARALKGAAEGCWIRAERQSAGRGRLGRKWESETGNLYASTIVRLRADDHVPSTLAFVAGIAVFKSVRPYLDRAQPQLKWPNDVLVEDRKLSGMLLERSGNAVVIGIGVNIAHSPDIPGRAVTSLHNESAPSALDAPLLMESLAENFQEALELWRREDLSVLLDMWQEHAHKSGTPITVFAGEDRKITGAYEGLSRTGSLKLRKSDGEIITIHAGDVEIIRDV